VSSESSLAAAGHRRRVSRDRLLESASAIWMGDNGGRQRVSRVDELRRIGRLRRGLRTAVRDWRALLHGQLGCAWPCPAESEFNALWAELTAELDGQRLQVGRGTYWGWDDGDRGLASAVWCLTRHLPAAAVVETGVARGITSRAILEALHRNGGGHLSSIDLPPPDRSLHGEIGAAVSGTMRANWTLLRGTSRSLLPSLLDRIGAIDLFVHDSSHTTPNVRFELNCAWPRLARGAVVVDDVERNDAFSAFTRLHPDALAFTAPADDGHALFGVALKGFTV
jgi:hypothetical protein